MNKREENNEDFAEIKEEAPKTVFEKIVLQNKKSNKNNKVFFIALISVSIAVAIALIVLGSYLNVYNKNSPTTVCDEILLAFEEKNAEPLLKYCTDLPRILSYKKNLSEYLEKYLPDDKFDYFEVASFNPEDKKYIFKAGNTAVAEIVFNKVEEKKQYNITSYSIDSFNLKSLTSYKIVSNSNYKLYVNGELVDTRYLFNRLNIATPISNFTEKPLTQDIYLIEELFYIADIKAYDFDGTPCEITFDSELMQYEISKSVEPHRKELTDFVNEFLPVYSNYILVDNRENEKILKYIHKKSYLYDLLKNYEYDQDYDYTESKLESLTLKDFISYGNNFYSADVSSNFELSNKKGEITRVGFNKKIFFLSEKDNFYVIDIVE